MHAISQVTHPEAIRFLNTYLLNRAINREFYELVQEEQYDYRMVDTTKRKSDSIRESIVHQICVQRTYLQAIEIGALDFKGYINATLHEMSKSELLQELDTADQELIEYLAQSDVPDRKVNVPWSKEPIPVVRMLWGLDSHEVLHTGWNIAVMDHLNINRFQLLQEMWG